MGFGNGNTGSRPTYRKIQATLLAVGLACLGNSTQAGETLREGTIPGLSLWVSTEPRIHLDECAPLARALPQPIPAGWQPVAYPLQLRWATTQVRVAGDVPPPAAGVLRDRCFALLLNGKVLVGGGLISRYSARLLRGPVLFDWTPPKSEIIELRLEHIGAGATADYLLQLEQAFVPDGTSLP